jgi:hypothetical protein
LPLAAASFMPRLPRRKTGKKSTIILKNFENKKLRGQVSIFFIGQLSLVAAWLHGCME